MINEYFKFGILEATEGEIKQIYKYLLKKYNIKKESITIEIGQYVDDFINEKFTVIFHINI